MPQTDQNEMLQILKGISSELIEAKKRDEQSEQRDAVMLSKIESIQEKLQELSVGQLEAILTQASNIAQEMAKTNDYTSMMIDAKALTDTVEIGKDELKELINDAFGGDSELKKQMEDGFMGVSKDAKSFYDSLARSILTHDSNHTNGVEAILESISSANQVLSSINLKSSNIQQRVNNIPTSGGLR